MRNSRISFNRGRKLFQFDIKNRNNIERFFTTYLSALRNNINRQSQTLSNQFATKSRTFSRGTKTLGRTQLSRTSAHMRKTTSKTTFNGRRTRLTKTNGRFHKTYKTGKKTSQYDIRNVLNMTQYYDRWRCIRQNLSHPWKPRRRSKNNRWTLNLNSVRWLHLRRFRRCRWLAQ